MSALWVFSAPWINRLDLFLLDFDCIPLRRGGGEAACCRFSHVHLPCGLMQPWGRLWKRWEGGRHRRDLWGPAPGGGGARLGEDVAWPIQVLIPAKEAQLYLSVSVRSRCCLAGKGESEVGQGPTRTQEPCPAGGQSPGSSVWAEPLAASPRPATVLTLGKLLGVLNLVHLKSQTTQRMRVSGNMALKTSDPGDSET